jgi:hypothetical protein
MLSGQTQGVGILDAAYFLPGPVLDLIPWAAQNAVSDEAVQELLENGCRYFHAGPEHSDVALMSAAVDQLALRHPAALEQVRYLVHTSTQAFSVPAPPSSVLTEIIRRFDLKPTLSFSLVHLACASVVAAIDHAARALAADRNANYALVVSADRVFGGPAHRIRQNAAIQSDGGSAILLAKQGFRARLGPASVQTHAKLHHEVRELGLNPVYMWLNTKRLLTTHSREAGVALTGYAALLPTNADKPCWLKVSQSLGLSDDAFFFDNTRDRGHACCTDFAVNLVDHGFALLDRGQNVASCAVTNIGAYSMLSLFPPTKDLTSCV